VSDADRDAALAELAAGFQEGRLDLAEFEERMDRAARARTGGDLAGLLADLPQPPPAADRTLRARWHFPLAVLAVLAIVAGVAIAGTLSSAEGPAAGHWAPWWLIPVSIVLLRGLWWRRVRASGRWR
jgi:hypothetical protein